MLLTLVKCLMLFKVIRFSNCPFKSIIYTLIDYTTVMLPQSPKSDTRNRSRNLFTSPPRAHTTSRNGNNNYSATSCENIKCSSGYYNSNTQVLRLFIFIYAYAA